MSDHDSCDKYTNLAMFYFILGTLNRFDKTLDFVRGCLSVFKAALRNFNVSSKHKSAIEQIHENRFDLFRKRLLQAFSVSPDFLEFGPGDSHVILRHG